MTKFSALTKFLSKRNSCTYQCKPVGGGGSLKAISITSVVGLIKYLCLGVGTLNFDLLVVLLLWEGCIC